MYPGRKRSFIERTVKEMRYTFIITPERLSTACTNRIDRQAEKWLQKYGSEHGDQLSIENKHCGCRSIVS